MTETPPPPAPPAPPSSAPSGATEGRPAPSSPAPTMKALENLEARVALLESTVKDQALELARLKALPAPAAHAPKKSGILRDR